MRTVILLTSCLVLSACSAYYGGPVLLSGGQSPPDAGARNTEPQPPGSLPVGFQGVGNSGPNTYYPNYASVRFPTPY